MVQRFSIQGNPKDIQTLMWVYVLPTGITQTLRSETFSEMYDTYYRLMFLTRHKVWFKNKKTAKGLRVILVPSPHKLSGCDRMFLKKKGYPIKAKGCTRDSCFQCRNNGLKNGF